MDTHEEKASKCSLEGGPFWMIVCGCFCKLCRQHTYLKIWRLVFIPFPQTLILCLLQFGMVQYIRLRVLVWMVERESFLKASSTISAVSSASTGKKTKIHRYLRQLILRNSLIDEQTGWIVTPPSGEQPSESDGVKRLKRAQTCLKRHHPSY